MSEIMTIEKAQEMMADAIKAMLDCGQFKVVETVAIRTKLIEDQHENLVCLVFGKSNVGLDKVIDSIKKLDTPFMLDEYYKLPKFELSPNMVALKNHFRTKP